ncbi:hypothetical protein ACDX78_04985 [Virgibacillus oceani]
MNLCVTIHAQRNMKIIVNVIVTRRMIVVMKNTIAKSESVEKTIAIVNAENAITVSSAIVVTDITKNKPSHRGLFIFFVDFIQIKVNDHISDHIIIKSSQMRTNN